MTAEHSTTSASNQATRHPVSRRDFFSRMGDGLYGAALASLLGADLFEANPALAASPGNGPRVDDLTPKPTHFRPTAKSVIQLFMNGGPSQVDLFDPKPELKKYAGQVPSRDLTTEVVTPTQIGGILPSPYQFSRHGECGMELSELLPYTARSLIELLTAKDGLTWTIILTSPQGRSCLIASGEGWRPLVPVSSDPSV